MVVWKEVGGALKGVGEDHAVSWSTAAFFTFMHLSPIAKGTFFFVRFRFYNFTLGYSFQI
jgi:hypothetical protein